MDQLFKINLSRMTARELWRHSPGPGTALPIIVLKTLGLLSFEDPTLHRFASFGELVIAESDLSQTARNALLLPIKGFTEIAFQPCAFHRLTNPYDPKNLDSGAVFLLHSSGEFVAMAAYVKRGEAIGIVERVVMGIFTDMQSRRRIGVTNSKAYLDPIGKSQTVYVDTRDPKVLLSAHKKQLAALRRYEHPILIRSALELEKQHDLYVDLEIEARRQRGLLVVPSAEELLAAQKNIQNGGQKS